MEDNPRYLKENFNALLGEMNKLKDLIKDSAKSGEQRMDTWSKSVKEKELEFEVIQKEFRDMPPPSFFTIKARKKLNKKVIETYKLVKVLREMADEISQIMETFISKVATEKALRFSPWQIRKYTSDFQTEILGSGGFGVVYAGELPNGVKIAVKKLRDGLMMHDIENQFMAEVRTMNASYHRNLAKLYGFCFCSELKALVYEYMEKGSFDKLLFDKRQNPSWRNLHGVAIETAKAISYLHDNCHDEQIIHRDIKAGNVLLDSKYTAKVSDFGLAKLCNRDKTHLSITGLREMRGYDAPEVRMDTPKITSKCDTFSFGIMLFEILSRTICDLENSFPRQVWEKYKNGNLDEMVTKCGIREKHKKESAKTVCIIAFWCLQYLPATRPSMSIVVKALEGDIIFTPPPNPFDPSSITASACISRASSTTTR